MDTGQTQSDERITVAVIGAGRIAYEHLRYLAGQTKYTRPDAQLQLAAVCDSSAAAAAYAAETFGAMNSYSDAAAMLDGERPDVVHVLTPPDSHVPLVLLCLEAGVHVLCEKPITPCQAQLAELIDLAADRGVEIMETHNYRFEVPVQQLHKASTSGRLGSISEVEIRLNLRITRPDYGFADPDLPSPLGTMPAGALHDFITHFGYLLLHLAPGVRYDHVDAAWNLHSGNSALRYDDLDAVLIGEGSTGPVHARLRFDARSAPEMFEITIRGTEGYASAELFRPHVRVVRERQGPAKLSPVVNFVAEASSALRAGTATLARPFLGPPSYDGLHRMLDLTYRALLCGETLPVTIREMLEASALVDQLISDAPDP